MNVTSELRSSHSSVSRDQGFVNDSSSSATMASSGVLASHALESRTSLSPSRAVAGKLGVGPSHVQRHEGVWPHAPVDGSVAAISAIAPASEGASDATIAREPSRCSSMSLDSGLRRSPTNWIALAFAELGRPRVERRSWSDRRGFAEQLPSRRKQRGEHFPPVRVDPCRDRLTGVHAPARRARRTSRRGRLACRSRVPGPESSRCRREAP